MKRKLITWVGPMALSVAALAIPATTTAMAAPPSQQTKDSVTDLGQTDTSQHVSALVVLKGQNQVQLQQFIQATVTPGNGLYHKFLTVPEFASRFAPSNGQINQVVQFFTQYGIHVDDVYADHLVMKISGTVNQFNAAFSTDIHDYSKNGKTFHRPKKAPNVPTYLQDSILAVSGLSTEALYHPMSTATHVVDQQQTPVVLPKDGTATGVPGSYTVGDVANLYDVNPLYQKGITGQGQTIGIATLADFNPQDAYDYWDAIGLNNKQDRITKVDLDGGAQYGADAGSGETTLDVQQSGGLAPNANIVVYDAPNTDAGFMDVFYKAISDNKVDTLSVSWGSPEFFYMDNALTGGDYTNELTAMHQAFMEAAAQGISVFAAAGDAGAYDVNRGFPYPYFSQMVSADAPASDPYITSAGGTTVPATLHMRHGDVTVSSERPWAWDYFSDYLTQWYGPTAPYDLGYFPVGGGGGVSSIWPLPSYQQGLAGVQTTLDGQSFGANVDLTDDSGNVVIPAGTVFGSLPGGFAGRNGPDLSMNADPETGYLVYSSADGGWIQEGGTSFVAPQLNGLTALLNEYTGGRNGFLNPTLYGLQKTDGYGPTAPFNDIVGGDNWYYQGTKGFDPATGIGTPNWSILADLVKQDAGN